MTTGSSKGVKPDLTGGVKPVADVLIEDIGELATPRSTSGPLRGRAMGEILRIKNAVVAISGESIVYAGPRDDLDDRVTTSHETQVVDARGGLVTPGLVDPHTHLIFAGNRADEFIMRCQGRTYAEIAEAGGGIVASMRATRGASVTELVDLGRSRLRRVLEAGTTTCEVKTGYGLSAESELNMLEAIYTLAREQAVELIPTFMPAHAIPKGVERSRYVDEVIGDMLPRMVKNLSALQGGKGGAEGSTVKPFVDVFCDKGYFTLDDTTRIFEAASSLGLKLKVHSDEFENLGATTLACEKGACSADHLLNVSDREIGLLAKSNTVAVLLPGTSFYLNLKEHARARKMIEEGVAVALGSDYNPGSCHIFSLTFIWGLSCLHLKLTPQEALSALTINAAHAVGAGDRVGQLTEGRQADVTIYDVRSLEEVPYNMGWNPVREVLKKGNSVYRR